ncbi:MAG: fibrinogen-like YCDxxxxGGGW domain-containing protein [Myxococcota bacterium]
MWFTVLFGSLLVGCQSDNGVKEFNDLPSIQIISHGDGSTFDEGITVTLVAQASDTNHEPTELLSSWFVDDALLCSDVPVDSEGLSNCETLIPPGSNLIRASVRDPLNGGGEDVIAISVVPNAPPIAEILFPLDGDTVLSTEPLTFEGQITDAEDTPDTLQFSLESDLDGVVSFEPTPDSSGIIEDGITLSPGQHRLTLTVTDSGGKTGTDSIGLEVTDVNSEPTCAITVPLTGEPFVEGPITFEGQAADIDQDADSLEVRWESSLDGVINSDPPDLDGALAFDAEVSSGIHEIVLTVTDSSGAVCTDSIDLIYSNGPDIVINSPLQGEYYTQGFPIAFSAQISDSIDPMDQLMVVWESSLEGLITNSMVDSAGESSTEFILTLNGPHVISASVIDSASQSSVATTSIYINAPPTAPQLTVTPDPAITTDTLTVTASGSIDYDNDPISYIYSWSLNGIVSNASNSATLPSSATAKGDVWTITVTPVDPLAAGPSTSTDITIVNAPPSLSSVVVSPSAPNNRETLQCTAVETDADPVDISSLVVTYQWLNLATGAVLGTNDSVTLTTGTASVFDAIQCTATVTDIDGATDTSSTQVTVGNTDPTVSAVTIAPSNPDRETTVTCSASTADLDGDSPTLSYEWFSNGASLGTGDTLDLTSTAIIRGDPLTCTATADDGNGGTSDESSTTVITNATPSITGVDILVNGAVQSTAQASDTLTCVPLNFTDADSDVPQYIYQWRTNGTPTASSVTISSLFQKNDTVSCEATPFDGNAFGTPHTQSVTIVNTAPAVDGIAFVPANPNTNDSIAVSISASDDDGDPISFGYEWFVNGQSVSTNAVLDTSLTAVNDTIFVTITPEDAEDVGLAVTSATLTIVNAPPVINSISATPIAPNNRDTLTCLANASDPDQNDTISVSYEWHNTTTSSTLANSNSVTLTQATATVGDVLTCTATVTDSSGETDIASTQVTIINTLPTITGFSIGPNPPNRTDTVNCTSSNQDLDGDTLVVNTVWQTGSLTLGTTGVIDLSLINIFRGDPLTCTITVDDGNGGVVSDSQTVTIANSIPTLAGVSILVNGIGSSTAQAGDTLNCSPQGYFDADGDTAQYIYQWRINGSSVSSSATLTSGFTRNDTVSCEATPFDGLGFGSSQISSVSILNSAPVVNGITLSPSAPTANSTITANISGSDADGDTVTYQYNWFVNANAVSSSTSLSSSFISQGDSIFLQVTPSDGITTGQTVNSSSLTVTNTAPTAPTILITPTNPVVGADDLICNVILPSTDTDGDAVSYSMTWLQNGTPYTGVTTTWQGDTVPAHELQVNDTWTCVATPNDGIDDGPTASANKTIELCLDGSIPACAATTCEDILLDGFSAGDGTYYLDPNGTGVDLYYCDMTNGGWTGINFQQANSYLNGILVAENPTVVSGIDPVNGPYTQDTSGGHTYHYTFDFNPSFSEFSFLNYDIRANAGNGYTTDLSLNSFIMTSWSIGYQGAGWGDVGFGSASLSGPTTTLSVDYGDTNSCQNCTYTMGQTPHSIGSSVLQFRIGWGENGSQHEGWYPWYDGLILLR